MSSSPKLSVVIATYNRCEVLAETLNRLDQQSIDPETYEVIVVDDGSPDNTEQIVHSAQEVVGYSLSYLRHDNRGPGYTENVGIKAAKCDLVLLIADDIWAHPKLLEEHLESHSNFTQPNVGVFGKVSQSPDLPQTVLHKYWDPFQFDRFKHGEEYDGVFFHACNISVKRDFLLNNGLFLECKGAAHEDIELGYRLSLKGLRLIYNEDASAVHQHVETLDGICRRAFERGTNFDLLFHSMPASVALPLYKISSPEAGIGQRLSMFPRELLRLLVFNGFFVRRFWHPILSAAENGGVARLFANSLAYRGVAGHYLRAGFQKMNGRKGTESHSSKFKHSARER